MLDCQQCWTLQAAGYGAEAKCNECRIRELWEEVALLRQERTAVQGLIAMWRKNEHHTWQVQVALDACADQLEQALSGAGVSSEAQDMAPDRFAPPPPPNTKLRKP